MTFKVGDLVAFEHYGEARRGVVTEAGTRGAVVLVRSTDRPAPRNFWLHAESLRSAGEAA
jgi:hypothetical protein